MKTVTLTSGLTQTIALAQTSWTASSNVTTTTNAATKLGANSSSIAIAAAFTTGLAAYFATGTLNLSSYNQVSFWIKCTSTIAACKNLSLRLCSDTAGVTTVNTITIPDLSGAILNTWYPITVDTAGGIRFIYSIYSPLCGYR